MLIKVVMLITVVLLFRWSSPVPLLRGIPIVSPVFRCSASAPVFHQCSGVLLVFCCSAGVPCSGVPDFIVCRYVWGLPHVYKDTMLTFHRNRYTYFKVLS